MKPVFALLCAICTLTAAAPQAEKKSTLTYTATSTITKKPTVSSGGATTVYTTYYSLRSGPQYEVIYDYTSTGTLTTYIFTSTSTVSLPAKKTVTAPTPAKFTPILSESYYTDGVTVSYVPVTVTSPVYLHPSTVTAVGNVVVSHTTTITSTSTTATYYYVNTTISTTETDSSATRTSFAACATNNLASKIPTGQGITTVNPFDILYYPDPQVGTAQECCAACFSTPNCTGGRWAQDSYYKTYYCEIFTLNANSASQTCDASKTYGTFDHSPNPYEFSPNVVFNGPCGQWSWQFEAENYNH